MTEERAIKLLKEDRQSYLEASKCGLGYPSDNREHKEKAEAIATVLNLIQRQDRQIDLMLGHIDPYRLPIEEKITECAKKYFAEQAKEVEE